MAFKGSPVRARLSPPGCFRVIYECMEVMSRPQNGGGLDSSVRSSQFFVKSPVRVLIFILGFVLFLIFLSPLF